MTVNYNRIVDNGDRHGLANNEPTALIDARFNWWGCNNGPNDPDCDHVTGNAVDQVNFQPWLVLSIQSDPPTSRPDSKRQSPPACKTIPTAARQPARSSTRY